MTWKTASPVAPVTDLSWAMFASAGPEDSPEPLRHFGPPGFARQDTTAARVVSVLLVATDEPRDGDYWAWLDYGVSEPCCIGATEAAMTQLFLIGEDAPGPREEEQIGQGRILRLRVSIVEEMLFRSGRHNWKISSAL